MLALFLRMQSLAYRGSPIKREKEFLAVKRPAVGDTIALAESRCNELSLTYRGSHHKRLRNDQAPFLSFEETVSRALLC